MDTKFETERTLIRPPEPSDAEAIARYVTDRDVWSNTFIPHPYALSDAHEFIERTQTSWREGTEHTFMIVSREQGEAIGGIGLMSKSQTHETSEIGYWLAAPFRRQGILTECLPVVLRFGFKTLNLHRITAHVFEGNEPSRLLLKKVGFREEGFFRRALKHRDNWRDAHLYALLAEDFQG